MLLYDEEVAEVILGLEDLPRTWGDNDFNDAVFSIKSTPESAIEKDNLTKVPNVNDSDADGLPDDQDEFPNDYRRTYSSYFPSQNGFVTLAYKDNWPSLGDYDFNDLVIRERLRTVYDANCLESGFILDGFIAARGASKSNGFTLRLVDIEGAQIESATLNINGNSYQKTVENNQTDAVISLWSNSQTYTQTGETGKCSLFNTNKRCTQFDPVPFSFDVKFTNNQLSLNHSVLDFFIYRTAERTLEIHMPEYAPTDWFGSIQLDLEQNKIPLILVSNAISNQ